MVFGSNRFLLLQDHKPRHGSQWQHRLGLHHAPRWHHSYPSLLLSLQFYLSLLCPHLSVSFSSMPPPLSCFSYWCLGMLSVWGWLRSVLGSALPCLGIMKPGRSRSTLPRFQPAGHQTSGHPRLAPCPCPSGPFVRVVFLRLTPPWEPVQACLVVISDLLFFQGVLGY